MVDNQLFSFFIYPDFPSNSLCLRLTMPLLKYPAYWELKGKSNFEQFGLDETIFWANGADIAPEYLFENGMPY